MHFIQCATSYTPWPMDMYWNRSEKKIDCSMNSTSKYAWKLWFAQKSASYFTVVVQIWRVFLENKSIFKWFQKPIILHLYSIYKGVGFMHVTQHVSLNNSKIYFFLLERGWGKLNLNYFRTFKLEESIVAISITQNATRVWATFSILSACVHPVRIVPVWFPLLLVFLLIVSVLFRFIEHNRFNMHVHESVFYILYIYCLVHWIIGLKLTTIPLKSNPI